MFLLSFSWLNMSISILTFVDVISFAYSPQVETLINKLWWQFWIKQIFPIFPFHYMTAYKEGGEKLWKPFISLPRMSFTALKTRTNLNKISNVKSVIQIKKNNNIFILKCHSKFSFLSLFSTSSDINMLQHCNMLPSLHAEIFNKYFHPSNSTPLLANAKSVKLLLLAWRVRRGMLK